MNILVVLGHPTPGSFNHAIAATAAAELEAKGHEVWFHDLYAEEFEPSLPPEEIPTAGTPTGLVELHCKRLAEADGIVIVHPNWWGAPPAIVKGWIDRVFRPELAYRFLEGEGGEGVPQGLLKATTAVILNTANTSEKREADVFGDPLDYIWRRCVFSLCGVHDVRRKTFSIVITSTPEERSCWLNEVRAMVGEAF
jgi:NAD(P)H dehydrogenase (quinone)